jgi:hypothetical protein
VKTCMGVCLAPLDIPHWCHCDHPY